jgi:hypothetical protein
LLQLVMFGSSKLQRCMQSREVRPRRCTAISSQFVSFFASSTRCRSSSWPREEEACAQRAFCPLRMAAQLLHQCHACFLPPHKCQSNFRKLLAPFLTLLPYNQKVRDPKEQYVSSHMTSSCFLFHPPLRAWDYLQRK